MSSFLSDVRHGVRGWARSPLFALVAIGSLTLGIGANTGIFTILDQLLLRSLPAREPGQLVLLDNQGTVYGSVWAKNALSMPMYRDLAAQNQVFSTMFGRYQFPAQAGYQGQTERITAELVTGTYFSGLGVGAARGRVLGAEDDVHRNAHPVVVLSHRYWRERFGADPAVVGKSMVVNSRTLTVLGVAAAGFDGVDASRMSHVFLPMAMKAALTPQWDDMDNRRSVWVHVYGRLKPGMTRERAAAALAPLWRGLREMETHEAAFRGASQRSIERFRESRLGLLPAAQGQPGLRAQLEEPLWILMAVVGLVLLIACANVANLLLARAQARRKEISLKLALGSGPWRVMQQLMTESLLLGVVGGALGVGVAWATARLLLSFTPPEANLALSAAPNARILAFNFGLALAATLVFGLFPAAQAAWSELSPVLKDMAGSVTAGSAQGRFRRMLVVSQVALSLLLLSGAGLLTRSLRNLKNLDPGFRKESLLSYRVDTSLASYDSERSKDFYDRLAERVRALPGVEAAAFAGITLLNGDDWSTTVRVAGYEPKPGESGTPKVNVVSPGFFAAMGIPVTAGREFLPRDRMVHPPDTTQLAVFRTAIANERFVKRYFAGRDPIGGRLGFGLQPGVPTPVEIVGVVRDVKSAKLREETPMQLYFPFLESARAGPATFYVRTTSAPEAAFGAIRQVVREMDGSLPVYELRTIEQQVNVNLVVERFTATLAAGFGGLATLLALIGLYGVMAYGVARRTREFGLRMAMGAQPADIRRLVLGEVGVLVGAGIAVGLPAALLLGRGLRSQLFGVEPFDPWTIALAVAALCAVAVAAGWSPAFQASRVDPMKALRHD